MLKFIPIGVLSLSFVGCVSHSENGKKNGIVMGGVPGWIAAGARIESEPEPVKPDPTHLPFKKKGGPVSFEMSLEKNFEPSPEPKRRTFLKKKDDHDPVPEAIEEAMDPGRNDRLKRLIR
ncbi:MAG: hypothetical protein P1V20_01965 [Verrucomicrobiales bacterium]|nr:hypothetical protein [Verrucomicrobiales bacterium]